MKKITFLLAFVLIVSLLCVACANDQVDPPLVDEPDIAGMVMEVSEDGMAILVDSNTNAAKGEIWVTITEATKFGLGVSSEFLVDNFVEITADGGIMESYPMQADATMVYTNEPLVD